MNYFTAVFQADPKEMPSLNGIRGIAIFMLMYVHMFVSLRHRVSHDNWLFANFLENGSSSIDMFFVLSGFLIAGPLLRELSRKDTIDLKSFYLKRTLRIFPPYYAFLAIQYFLVLPAIAKSSPVVAANIETVKNFVWADFFYVSNYFPKLIVHGWSLSFEEQFYLMLPAFLLLVYRKVSEKYRLALLLSLVLGPLLYRLIYVATVISAVTPNEGTLLYTTRIYYPLEGHLDSILIGVTIAHIYFNKPQWVQKVLTDPKWYRGFLTLSLGLIISWTFLFNEYFDRVGGMILRFAAFSWAWGILLILSLKENTVLHKVLSWKVFRPFAKLSYCAYIIHLVIMMPFCTKIFGTTRPIQMWEIMAWFIPTGLVVFFFAYFFHLLTERPFLMLKDYILEKKKLSSIPKEAAT
ncbi:hypothetical protein CH373_12100 [Leptospira perolatii]|uniref:Acyltransferase 3 domain-containing protein n=1 Tax=Leptospira perolatii TaxID=2023191 RepID=A0A2M9ZL34_9LEPT|nr:acyltransferase [Leptospira perolatii]PJZ70316.1 hypothetical protein CH360_06870 [Leptospira perolatii]PJZ72800.1 hypothetical protein CH373_12100 [Leptospira perolatii]